MKTTDETTPVAGQSNRRKFLFAGTAGVAASAFIAACGKKVNTQKDFPLTGTSPTSSEATVQVVGPEFDVTMLRTAQSLELAAIESLKQLSATQQQLAPAVLPTFEFLIGRHTDHASYFADQTTAAGGEPYNEPNTYFMESVFTPALAQVAAPKDILAIAVTVENTLAQTYVFAAELMSTLELRQAVATIGFVAARQISTIYLLQGGGAAPTPVISRGARVPAKAYIPES